MKINYTLIFILCNFYTYAQTIEFDDTLHVATGAVISACTYKYVYNKTNTKKTAFLVSFGTAILAGFAKELYDKNQPGNSFDTKEWLLTASAGLTVSISFNIFSNKK